MLLITLVIYSVLNNN